MITGGGGVYTGGRSLSIRRKLSHELGCSKSERPRRAQKRPEAAVSGLTPLITFPSRSCAHPDTFRACTVANPLQLRCLFARDRIASAPAAVLQRPLTEGTASHDRLITGRSPNHERTITEHAPNMHRTWSEGCLSGLYKGVGPVRPGSWADCVTLTQVLTDHHKMQTDTGNWKNERK